LVVVLEDFNGIYTKFMMGDGILDDELTQIREILVDIATRGTKTFILWFQGVESSEMTNRERILEKLSSAGLVDLEWRFTHHNAYIKTRITEKGTKLIKKLIGVKPANPVA
jgi:chloramphenicol 3-O-phosphotransferase